MRSDNGSEFTSDVVRGWLRRLGVQTLFIEPGSPWENGYIESFNGKLRDELLKGEIFDTVIEARIIIERWRKEYNTRRPHSSLGYLTTKGDASSSCESMCRGNDIALGKPGSQGSPIVVTGRRHQREKLMISAAARMISSVFLPLLTTLLMESPRNSFIRRSLRDSNHPHFLVHRLFGNTVKSPPESVPPAFPPELAPV